MNGGPLVVLLHDAAVLDHKTDFDGSGVGGGERVCNQHQWQGGHDSEQTFEHTAERWLRNGWQDHGRL
jgi:hypothetical protein